MVGRKRGRHPGQGASFPGGSLAKLERALVYFHGQDPRHWPSERQAADYLSMTTRTIQRALKGVGWNAWAEARWTLLNNGWHPPGT